MATLTGGDPCLTRPPAYPAFRGQGGYGALAGARTQVAQPVAGLARQGADYGVESTVKDAPNDQGN